MVKKKLYVGQSILAFFLVLFTLASGHLFMVIINHIDLKTSREFYKNNRGIEGKWLGDFSIKKEIELNLKESKKKKISEEIKIYEKSLSLIEKDKKIKFYLLPVSKFIVYSMLSLFLTGFLILLFSKNMNNDVFQSIAGLIAGLFL